MRIPLFPLVVVASLALASCAQEAGENAPDSAEAAPQSEATPAAEPEVDTDISVAESGWLTVGSDGAVQRTYFDADGRYRDLRNGELFGSGTWEQRPDGKVCFEPESGRGDCWETDKADKNGEASATNGEGKTIAIKQITYLAPPEDQ